MGGNAADRGLPVHFRHRTARGVLDAAGTASTGNPARQRDLPSSRETSLETKASVGPTVGKPSPACWKSVCGTDECTNRRPRTGGSKTKENGTDPTEVSGNGSGYWIEYPAATVNSKTMNTAMTIM